MRAHEYDSVKAARKHLTDIGRIIERDGLPEGLCPFTVGILGYGNDLGRRQENFDCLPTQRIAPDDINAFVKEGKSDRHSVYVSVFKEADLVQPKNAESAFDLQEYFDHPERYQSRFEPFLPSFTLLVNAVYWEKRYPRFVTWEGLKRLAAAGPDMKLAGIADITCDTHDGHIGKGIVLLAVDNLPCELPNDSSAFFSNQLKPFVPGLLKADYESSLETSGLPPEIQRAVIVYNGNLTPAYAYLSQYFDQV